MNEKSAMIENLKRVNESGFPLQLGLERLIQDTKDEHIWRFLSREHPWKNDSFGSGGFIDLIIENQHRTEVMVIECKRVQNASWIFLVPVNENSSDRIVKAWLFKHKTRNDGLEYFDWKDLALDPPSPMSAFCVISDKNRPMLEKVASELIEATEALAIEEYNLKVSEGVPQRIYYSVIVTTAELKICNYDPKDIHIESGMLKESNFTTVPFIRFKKSLSLYPPKPSNFKNIKELDIATERTVLIVNSSSMQGFLKSFKVDLQSSHLL